MYEELKALNASMNEKHTFTEGQIVTWKPFLKNKASDGPFVVHQILSEPVLDPSQDGGSAYFREPLDILLARQDSDGDFIIYHYDSRRFEPVSE